MTELMTGLMTKPTTIDGLEGADVAQLMIQHALERGASHVHIDAGAEGIVVRERVQGALERLDPPLPAAGRYAIARALKTMAGVDPDIDGRAQTGHMVITVGGQRHTCQVTTYPGSLGESVIVTMPIRMAHLSLEDLHYTEEVLGTLRQAFTRPFGLVIAAGPTGSGKSTSLYALVRELHRPSWRLMTAEETVVVHIDGAVQAHITADFSVEDALRAMLQTDVDIAMVSDLPTPESVRLACDVAKTGHFMLTQRHGPDAAAVVHGLLRQGDLDPELVIETLSAVLAQRLVRLSCDACRKPRRVSAAEADRMGITGAARRAKGVTNSGCDECQGTGTRRRAVVAEALTMTAELAAALRRPGVTLDDIRAARAGCPSIEDDVRAQMLAGRISVDEALEQFDHVVPPYRSRP